MRKIIVSLFTTMDGVIQGPGGQQEDTTGNFEWSGWTVPFSDDAIVHKIGKMLSEPYDLLLGHFTYDIFAAYWPYQKGNFMSEAFERVEKYVVANTPVDLSWDKSTLITGDVVAELKKLKGTDGPNLVVFGSANFFQTLLQHQLVDEVYQYIYPITLGAGKKIFQNGAQAKSWNLTSSEITKTGVIMATYSPAGEVKTGTFGSQEISDKEAAHRERMKAL